MLNVSALHVVFVLQRLNIAFGKGLDKAIGTQSGKGFVCPLHDSKNIVKNSSEKGPGALPSSYISCRIFAEDTDTRARIRLANVLLGGPTLMMNN